MGFEIVYCARCGNRILREAFDRHRAFWVGARGVCSDCVRKELAMTHAAPGRPVVLRNCRLLRGAP
jgi:hypothetical protein